MIIWPGWITPGKTTVTVYNTFLGIWVGVDVPATAIKAMRVAFSSKAPTVTFARRFA